MRHNGFHYVLRCRQNDAAALAALLAEKKDQVCQRYAARLSGEQMRVREVVGRARSVVLVLDPGCAVNIVTDAVADVIGDRPGVGWPVWG